MIAAAGGWFTMLLPALAELVAAVLLYLLAPTLGRLAASGLGGPVRIA
jgi:hypothetical protein